MKDVAPDVRVETERRLKALEADLARSELAKKERTLAVRYHKVKFFGTRQFITPATRVAFFAKRSSYVFLERQKVTRKIQQTAKRLSSSTSPNPELENALFELRVDLNYILVGF